MACLSFRLAMLLIYLGSINERMVGHEDSESIVNTSLGLRALRYSDPKLLHVGRREVHLEQTEVDFSTLFVVGVIGHSTVPGGGVSGREREREGNEEARIKERWKKKQGGKKGKGCSYCNSCRGILQHVSAGIR